MGREGQGISILMVSANPDIDISEKGGQLFPFVINIMRSSQPMNKLFAMGCIKYTAVENSSGKPFSQMALFVGRETNNSGEI